MRSWWLLWHCSHPHTCKEGKSPSWGAANMGAQCKENHWGLLILELCTCTGSQAHWWWVAAEEKQEASPRSWHLPAPNPAAGHPLPSQLPPSLPQGSIAATRPLAGQEKGGEHWWREVFDLAVAQQALWFLFKHPQLRSALAWQTKLHLNTKSQLGLFSSLSW